MIVCSCRAVTDRALLEAVQAGRTPDQIVSQTGAGSDCGCCAEAVADILSRAAGPCRGAQACPGCPRRAA